MIISFLYKVSDVFEMTNLFFAASQTRARSTPAALANSQNRLVSPSVKRIGWVQQAQMIENKAIGTKKEAFSYIIRVAENLRKAVLE